MKYGQEWSAHWEGAVGEWLRGQLDARGIHAPAYGRYVLSLLTRPLDPADLSPSPIGAKTWERRNKFEWAPVKIEALKRSAAVQCLINATDDQNSGIEQLVDELCDKLKEVDETNAQQSKKDTRGRLARRDRSRPLSPAEMARLYYAAFPALGPANASGPQLPPPPAPAPVPASHRDKENIPRRNVSCGKDWPRPRPRHPGQRDRRTTATRHRPRRTLPEWLTRGAAWDAEAHDPIRDFVEGVVVDEGYGTCDNTAVEDLQAGRRLYQRDSDSSLGDEDFLPTRNWIAEEEPHHPTRSLAEEESIARFEAKFDRSLEALWSKEQNNTPDDEYQELPVDFQDLLSSPSDTMFDTAADGKAIPISLTASIWSNCDSLDRPLIARDRPSRNRDPRECTLFTLDRTRDAYDIFRKVDTSPDYGADDGSSVYFSESRRNLWESGLESYDRESMEVIYNKLEPLILDDIEDNSHNINADGEWSIGGSEQIVAPPSKWSDAAGISDPYAFQSYNDVFESAPVATIALRSLTALNHSRLYSSFTEVIPRAPSGFVGDGIARRYNETVKSDLAELPDAVRPSSEKEEDLLTSMRTHFKPIKRETAAGVQNTAVDYADGMTFSIISDLDDVKFNRSRSGTIFLESEGDPPVQYMEYRTQGIDYSRLGIYPSSACSDDGLISTDLILKFKVRQNEKSAQTEWPTEGCSIDSLHENEDTSDDAVISFSESPIASPNGEAMNTLAAPDVIEESDVVRRDWIQCDECKTNRNSWFTENGHVFEFNPNEIWSSDDDFCRACAEQRASARAEHCDSRETRVIREEAARDWDELLSDISYVHTLQEVDGHSLAPAEITLHAADGNFLRSALLARQAEAQTDTRGSLESDVRAWLRGTRAKQDGTVGHILDRSLSLYGTAEPHCQACAEDWSCGPGGPGGQGDRKRRHSAASGAGAKQRCAPPAPPPPRPPLLPATERSLTR